MSDPVDDRGDEQGEELDGAREEERRRARRRARLDAVFGDVLPGQTSDDRDPSCDGRGREGRDASEDWLRAQVPPHHGG